MLALGVNPVVWGSRHPDFGLEVVEGCRAEGREILKYCYWWKQVPKWWLLRKN